MRGKTANERNVCCILLAQASDDLCLMTLRTAIARYHFCMAADLLKTAHWSELAARLFPLMKGW